MFLSELGLNFVNISVNAIVALSAKFFCDYPTLFEVGPKFLSGKIWGFQDTTTLLKKNDNSCDIDNASF